MRDLASLMQPMLVYLRHFDGADPKMNEVVPMTESLIQTIDIFLASSSSAESSCDTFRGHVPCQFLTEVKTCLGTRSGIRSLHDLAPGSVNLTRVDGPRTQHIQVLLCRPVHFLAAFLDPRAPSESQGRWYALEKEALSIFVHSTRVFDLRTIGEESKKYRQSKLESEMSSFIVKCGSLSHGLTSIESMSHIAWWHCYGASVPILRRIALILLSLSPSSCPSERSFSIQGSINTLKRNRLSHSTVQKLLYCNINLRLLDEISFGVPDFYDSVVAMPRTEGEGAENEVSEEEDIVSEVFDAADARDLDE
jgi:hAT family C-terminal dimerisation region